MARGSSSPRKRRTREHVLADLGVNFVERQALLCGYAVDRVFHDYGIDLLLLTYDEDGNTESGWIPLQVKATDKISLSRDGGEVTIRIDHADLRAWIAEPYPVILIVFDARIERAYWLYVQEHFADNRFGVRAEAGRTTVRIPVSQQLGPDAIRRFAPSATT